MEGDPSLVGAIISNVPTRPKGKRRRNTAEYTHIRTKDDASHESLTFISKALPVFIIVRQWTISKPMYWIHACHKKAQRRRGAVPVLVTYFLVRWNWFLIIVYYRSLWKKKLLVQFGRLISKNCKVQLIVFWRAIGTTNKWQWSSK